MCNKNSENIDRRDFTEDLGVHDKIIQRLLEQTVANDPCKHQILSKQQLIIFLGGYDL